jgi:hypothetical protein
MKQHVMAVWISMKSLTWTLDPF